MNVSVSCIPGTTRAAVQPVVQRAIQSWVPRKREALCDLMLAYVQLVAVFFLFFAWYENVSISLECEVWTIAQRVASRCYDFMVNRCTFSSFLTYLESVSPDLCFIFSFFLYTSTKLSLTCTNRNISSSREQDTMILNCSLLMEPRSEFSRLPRYV